MARIYTIQERIGIIDSIILRMANINKKLRQTISLRDDLRSSGQTLVEVSTEMTQLLGNLENMTDDLTAGMLDVFWPGAATTIPAVSLTPNSLDADYNWAELDLSQIRSFRKVSGRSPARAGIGGRGTIPTGPAVPGRGGTPTGNYEPLGELSTNVFPNSFLANDVITISNARDSENNGVYTIESISGSTITLKGELIVQRTWDFTITLTLSNRGG